MFCRYLVEEREVCYAHGNTYKNADDQGLSQDLETGCPKLAIVKILGAEMCKDWDHNILRFQP